MLRLLLAFLVCVGAAACDDAGPAAQQPCALECGQNGACVVELGSEACACAPGYEGPACGVCAPLYVSSEGGCVPDPCAAAPCRGEGQSVCVAVGSDFRCGCDPGYQDNNDDGACRPGCELLHPGVDRCEDEGGLAVLTGARSCQTLLRFDSGNGGPSQVFVAGEFNGWDNTALPMAADDAGILWAALDLAEGDWGYKLYDAQADVWFEDPANPLFKWVDGTRNSRLRVPDCGRPQLQLLGVPRVDGGRIEFEVQHIPGAGSSPAEHRVRLATGEVVDVVWDSQTGVGRVRYSGTETGKRLFYVDATDDSDRAAETLLVPVWVEAERFDWRDATLYFAMTDRFADGEPANNAPVPGVEHLANWNGGDFKGLQRQIEAGYFETLGVNAIWISSIVQNTQRGWPGGDGRDYTGYHSYWPISTGWTDENELPGVVPIEPHFGSMDDLRAMVTAAHDRGIRVIVDLVANQVHEDSPWWQNEQGQGFFHEPGFGCQESNWQQPIECWFAGYLPDLRYKNVETMNRVADHAWWLVRETGIDGFRLDAVKHMIDDFGYAIRHTMNTRLANTGVHFYMVGETFTGEDGYDEIRRYVSPEQLDGQFDFPLYWQLTDVFMRESRDMKVLESTPWDYGEASIMSNFLGNHDVCRALSHANGDIGDLWCNGGKAQGWDNPPLQPTAAAPYEKLRLAWTYLLTTRGVPLIYYGDEIGLAGAGDPDNRRLMPFSGWNPEQQRTYDHLARLGKLRREHSALRRGSRETLHMSNDGLLWIYRMTHGEDAVVVALNRSEGSRILVGVEAPLRDALSDEVLDGPQIELPGHTSAVFIEVIR